MAADSPLDPEALDQLRAINPDDDGELLRELIGIFLADTPKRIAELIQASQATDQPALIRAAHSIKGSAGNFGANTLTQIALEIEQLGKAGQLPAASAKLTSLQAEYDRVRLALESHLAHG